MPGSYTVFTPNTFVVGGGNNAANNALGLNFPDAALAGPPFLEAYSNTTPAVVASGSNDDATFSNISTVKDSCVFAVATKNINAGVADWVQSVKPFGVDSWATGPGSVKKLYGTESNLQLSPNDDVASWANTAVVYPFNLSYRVGPQTLTGTGQNTFYLGARYIYTGATDPTAVWLANAGTDGSPVWRAWSGNNTGSPALKLVHANAGTNPASPVLTKPSSGKLYSGSIVVVA